MTKKFNLEEAFDMKSADVLDLDRIICDKDFCAITKNVAIRLRKQQYFSIAEFFRTLSNNDLGILNLMVGHSDGNQDSQFFADIFVIALLLAEAEGVSPDTPKKRWENTNYFATLIGAASLERKGLVAIIWENVSFSDDCDDSEILKVL